MNAERLESRRLLAFTPFTDEVPVPGSSPDSYDLAVAGDGSYIAAYADGTAVRAVRYSARGEQVGVTTAASFATAVVNDVSVAMDADGDAVIAYTSFEPSANFGEFRYSHINRSGVVDDSGVLDIFDRGRAADVAVSMDPGGGFFIGSIGYVARAAYQLRFRAFDASGVLRGPAFTAFQQTLIESAVDNLDVGAFHDGSGAVFAYAFVDEGGLVQRVNYGRVSTSALVGSIGKIEAAEVHLPSVAIHSDGSFAIAYEQRMIDDRGFPTLTWRDCRIRRFSASGVQVGNVISTSGPFGDVNFVTPNLSATPDGGLVITYIERRHNDLQGNSHDTNLYARRYTAAGERVGLAHLNIQSLPLGREFEVLPIVGVGPEGKAVVAYSELLSNTVRFRRELPDAERVGAELFINGTDVADHLTVERDGTSLVVRRDDGVVRVERTFDAADVRFLSINGYGGDDDIVNATDLPSTIHGGDGADTIWGGTGPDSLRGFGGNDSLRGGDGDDVIFGDNGDDTLHGGDGVDMLIGPSFADVLLFGEVLGFPLPVPHEASVERRGLELFVNGSDSSELIIVETVREKLFVNIDGVVTGFRTADVQMLSINGFGGDDDIVNATALPATIHGGDGKDTIWGGIGPDSIRGQGGEDRLHGGDGNDLLFGDTANDTLHGGDGTDTLTGGTGADELLFGELLDGMLAVETRS